MGRIRVKTKAQYQAAVRELTARALHEMERLRVNSAQEFGDYCMNVLAYAVERAPVDDGTLRGTAFLEINGEVVATGEGGGNIPGDENPPLMIHARVVFPQKDYALIQHEHPEFNHPKGGQAFYLEIGLAEATREHLHRVYEAIWR